LKKKVLISQAWTCEDVPHMDEYISALEANGCEVDIYPSTATMNEEEIKKCLPGYFAHICGGVKYTEDVINSLDELKIISRIGVGYETVDVAAASKKGVAVTITPGAGAETVSEHAFTMIAALSRRIFDNDKMVRSGGWTTITGNSIYRKTLGILGCGRIGKQLAKWAQGFGMKIIIYDTFKDEKFAEENNVTYMSLEEVLKESDFVSIHLPLLDTTRGIIGEKELAMMKKSAIIINAARGGIIDETALYNALKNGVIAGAALDVFTQEPIDMSNPLLTLDNVIFSPHMAGSTHEGLDAIVSMAVNNVIEYINGEVPKGILNKEVI